MKKTGVMVGLLLGLSMVASVASADPTKKDDDYGYQFRDDLLKGDSQGAMAARIQVIPTGRRDRLLRPRVHFVAEMLKSVENM